MHIDAFCGSQNKLVIKEKRLFLANLFLDLAVLVRLWVLQVRAGRAPAIVDILGQSAS